MLPELAQETKKVLPELAQEAKNVLPELAQETKKALPELAQESQKALSEVTQEIKKQAGTELGQAQLKLELYYTLIFCRFGLIELTGWYINYFDCIN